MPIKKKRFKGMLDALPVIWRVVVVTFVAVAFRGLLMTKKYRMPPVLVNPTYAAICSAVGIVSSAVKTDKKRKATG